MKYLLIHLFMIAGQSTPEVSIEPFLQSRAKCETYLESGAYGIWKKSQYGVRDDGKTLMGVTSQCVGVPAEDIDILKDQLR